MISYSVLCTVGAVRSGYGRLSLSALARCLPTVAVQKTRYKRLGRFLESKHFTPETMIPELTRLVVGRKVKGRVGRKAEGLRRLVPILVDHTDIGGTPTLMAGVSHHGRVVPMAVSCFESARLRRSQNTLETAFLTLIVASLGAAARAGSVGDRQYGRFQLLHALNGLGQLYVLRCKTDVILWQDGKERFRRRFCAPPDKAIRYARLKS